MAVNAALNSRPALSGDALYLATTAKGNP